MAANRNPEVNVETESHPNGGEDGERAEEQRVREREMGFWERKFYLQMELYADEEDDSTENKRKKRMARAALTEWKDTFASMRRWKLQAESEMRSTMNEVYNLVSLYSVFEGVVLTAVTTSSRMECQHLWSPVGLSLFAYSMIVVVAFTKFRDIHKLRRKKEAAYHTGENVYLRISKLEQQGYADFDFDFDSDVHETWCPRKIHFWRNALGLIVPLTIFTVGLVFSFVHILCWS